MSLLSRSDEANKRGKAITFKLEWWLDREGRRKQHSEVAMVHSSGSNKVVVGDGWLAITAPLPCSLCVWQHTTGKTREEGRVWWWSKTVVVGG
ncbi:unnamed protein product [Lactuca virosa]|uniref:Uncharacterized protein n=1 Tax=Lactuca virosa TaxID=75947 RepID=A0AAU9PR08_9ASTR|nr:unnamed protein product [Lactuca virosa]